MSIKTSAPTLTPSQCSGGIFNVDDAPGDCITRADFIPLNTTSFAAQGFVETGMDDILANHAQARLMGVQESSLSDLVLSRHVKIPEVSGGAQQSIIAPYDLIPRQNVVNLNYFLVSGGSATAPTDPATAFASTLPATAYYLTVKCSTNSITDTSGGFGSAFKNLENYFLPGMYLIVQSSARHTGADYQSFVGASYLDQGVRVQYRVVQAVGKAADTDTAYVVVAPTEYQSYEASASSWASAVASTASRGAGVATLKQAIAGTKITKGTLLLLTNSVSDYESWCYQQPAVNNLGFIEYWDQTHRWTDMYNDEWLKALSAPNMSQFFKKFRTLPLGKQQAQRKAAWEKWYLNTVFYGQRISDKQNQTDWKSLPPVYDTTNPNNTLEFKSNTLGIFTQLNECGMDIDMNGAALDVDSLQEHLYSMKRERGNTGKSINMIECMGDRFAKNKLHDLMVKYYMAKYGTQQQINYNMNPGQKIIDQFSGRILWEYDDYELYDIGLTLRYIHHDYFDDFIAGSAFLGDGAGTKNIARQLIFLDWPDIQIAVKASKSVKRQTNENDELYKCQMTVNMNHYMLNSRKFQVRVGNVNLHRRIFNFSDACPTITVSGCDPTTT